MFVKRGKMVNPPALEVPDNRSVHSVHRNAVRSDAGEDRTVLHTVSV
jgi:hypothetical protein